MISASRSLLAAIALAVASSIVACGPIQTTPIGVPVVALPNGASTLVTTSGSSSQVTVSEPDYAGTFTAVSSNTAIATVAPAVAQATSVNRRSAQSGDAQATFVVTGVSSGTATITITDQFGRTSVFTVTVTSSSATPSPAPSTSASAPAVSASPASFELTAVGRTQSITVSQSGYAGPFTAVSSSTGVATVTPASGDGPFTVTAVAAGSATITFTGEGSASTTAGVTVTTSSGTVESWLRK